jgi:hypothetical protein
MMFIPNFPGIRIVPLKSGTPEQGFKIAHLILCI